MAHLLSHAPSLLVGMAPFFSLIGMPIFGLLVDRCARRSLPVMFGPMVILPVFPVFGHTNIPPHRGTSKVD